MRRLRFWWHDLRDRHWPKLIGDGTFENSYYLCSCGLDSRDFEGVEPQ